MATLILNAYRFRMVHGQGVETHTEVNTSQARATRKAAGWAAGVWQDYPDARMECFVSLGTGQIEKYEMPTEIDLDVPIPDECIIR
jgi:hypothetical protein